MTLRTCPACSRRYTMIVDPDCPICSGAGTLYLGQAAGRKWSPEAMSRAVEYALEAEARDGLAAGQSITAVRKLLKMCVRNMTRVGLLSPRPTPPVPANTAMSVQQIHAEAVAMTPAYRPGDQVRIDAPAMRWNADDRPLAAGGVPGFSLAGYVSNMARVADPIDMSSHETRTHTTFVTITEKTGEQIGAAARDAARRK